MNYENCQKLVDAIEPLLVGTPYTFDYDMSGECFFIFEDDIIETYELPQDLQDKVNTITDSLEIEY